MTLALLAIGAALGLAMAAVSLLHPWASGSRQLPAGAAAEVNGEVISRDAYQRAAERLAADSKDPLNDAQRAFVLERMIEEELLVQRGLAIGLPETERAVRAAIIRAVIASVTAEAEAKPVGESELRRFYSENSSLFASVPRLRVAAVKVQDRAGAERVRARAAAKLPLGDGAALALASAAAPLVPDAPIPMTKLREYLGPTAAEAAASLSVGETSAPIAQGNGFLVLQLVGREPGSVPPFEAIRDEVSAAYRRHAGDSALRDYLERLKGEATIVRGRDRQ